MHCSKLTGIAFDLINIAGALANTLPVGNIKNEREAPKINRTNALVEKSMELDLLVKIMMMRGII
ncbi:MAG: hypothetical protein WBF90_24405 [Rivularia sp. (in: cyanobacteria)]